MAVVEGGEDEGAYFEGRGSDEVDDRSLPRRRIGAGSRCRHSRRLERRREEVSRRDAVLNEGGMSGVVCLLVGRLASRHLAIGGLRFKVRNPVTVRCSRIRKQRVYWSFSTWIPSQVALEYSGTPPRPYLGVCFGPWQVQWSPLLNC